jgi:hypothetical protein
LFIGHQTPAAVLSGRYNFQEFNDLPVTVVHIVRTGKEEFITALAFMGGGVN